ncbi:MAG: TonB-dependent receptor [Bacteroidaceae bacterium]|nr:TonB-dependent receptor [Bacteroidaceae bacterium]
MDFKRIIQKASATLLLSMLCLFAYAQKSVTLTVVDDLGEPMIGVSALVKGTSNGQVSDLDGKIRLNNVKPSDVIEVSYMGFVTQNVKVGNRNVIKVELKEDTEALDEVVVVGYGVMKKTDLTGSIASIGTEKLLAKGAPSVLENLQGSVPGVSITQSSGRAGGGFDIEIRGKSSINSETTPMYVVDGVICDDIDFLNPQDIERMDVLKDASSTAIYGSRATAGVVMVTTKSGSGVTKSKTVKPSISYDGYYGITKTARMPDFMDGQQFYDYRFMKFLVYAEGGSATATSGRPAYAMGPYQQMSLWNSEKGISRLKELVATGQTYDWPDLVTQDGHQQNHYLSMSGGTDKLGYHMGIGYNSEEGIYEGDEQNRINFKGSIDAEINKYVSAGFSFNMARIDKSYANDDAVQNAYRMNPFMQPYDAEGNMNPKPGDYVAMGADNGYQFSDQPTPFAYIDNQTKERETWRMLGNFYLQIKPIKGLSLKTTFSPNYSYYREGTFNKKSEDGLISAYAENNRAIKTTSRAFSWTWDNIVNYNTTIAEKHSIDLMGLFSMEGANTEYDTFESWGVLDGSDWNNLSSGGLITDSETSKNSFSESSMISYALRANYTYAGKYMFTGTVRWDGSSRFADGHRWGSFPSLAVAWRMSEESWMKREWLSNLKLRLSYGMTGNNDGIGNYATQQTVAGPLALPFGSAYANAFYPSGIVDRALSWETSEEVNFGIDFGFFNSRITGTIDLYQKDSRDILFGVPLPLEAGANSSGGTLTMNTNIGKVRNRGIEASLTTVNVTNKDWHWETTFSFAANDNEVKDVNGLKEDMPSAGLFIGQPFHNVYGYEWTGIVSDKNMVVPDNEIARLKGLTPGSTMKEYDYYYQCYGWTEGQVIINDRNGDGKFGDEDKKVYSATPAWTGSFTSNLSYKEWDLSFSLYTKQDYTVSSNFYGENLNWGDRGRAKLNVDYYIPAGTLIDCDGVNADGTYVNPVYQKETHYGSYPFPNNGGANGGVGSDLWIGGTNKYVDASYVKVKNITLGYTFNKKVLKKIGLQKLRLYATVTNPFVFTDYKGFDPEWADASLKNDGPSTVTWQFGASVKF